MKRMLMAALAVAAIVVPAASATPPDSKVTICHATGSATNPFVIITIAKAGNDHGHIGVGNHQDGADSYFVDGSCGDHHGDDGSHDQ